MYRYYTEHRLNRKRRICQLIDENILGCDNMDS